MDWLLGSRPVGGGSDTCLAWSDANQLACATEKAVHIVTPRYNGTADRVCILVDALPKQPAGAPDLPAAGDDTDLRPADNDTLAPAFRIVAWSPRLARQRGRCLLAACTRSHVVGVFEAAAHPARDAWRMHALLTRAQREAADLDSHSVFPETQGESAAALRRRALLQVDLFETTAMAWSPPLGGDSLLCCGNKAGTVMCWSWEDEVRCVLSTPWSPELRGSVVAMAWSLHNRLAVSLSSGGILLYQVDNNQFVLLPWPQAQAARSFAASLAWNDAGDVLAAVFPFGVQFMSASGCTVTQFDMFEKAPSGIAWRGNEVVLCFPDGSSRSVGPASQSKGEPICPASTCTGLVGRPLPPRIWGASWTPGRQFVAQLYSQYEAKGAEIADARICILPFAAPSTDARFTDVAALPLVLWEQLAYTSLSPSDDALAALVDYSNSAQWPFALLANISAALGMSLGADSTQLNEITARLCVKVTALSESRRKSVLHGRTLRSPLQKSSARALGSTTAGASAELCAVCAEPLPVPSGGTVACANGHVNSVCAASGLALRPPHVIACALCNAQQVDIASLEGEDREYLRSVSISGECGGCVECGGPQYRPADRLQAYW